MRLIFLILFFAGSAFADTSSQWNGLISQIVAHGEQSDSGEGLWRTLSKITPPDTTKSHQADYMSTVGAFDQSNKYIPFEVDAVSENWRLFSDHWEIDQWLYTLSVAGELQEIEHYQIEESLDHEILKDDFIPTGAPTSPSELARWNSVLQRWY